MLPSVVSQVEIDVGLGKRWASSVRGYRLYGLLGELAQVVDGVEAGLDGGVWLLGGDQEQRGGGGVVLVERFVVAVVAWNRVGLDLDTPVGDVGAEIEAAEVAVVLDEDQVEEVGEFVCKLFGGVAGAVGCMNGHCGAFPADADAVVHMMPKAVGVVELPTADGGAVAVGALSTVAIRVLAEFASMRSRRRARAPRGRSACRSASAAGTQR